MVARCPAPVVAPRRGNLKLRVPQLHRAYVLAVLLVVLFLAPLRAPGAQTLGLTINPSTVTGNPDNTVTFSGMITNITGVALSSTDLFLNFIGYDADVFADISQVLGNTPFVIPNNSVSAIVPLFRVLIASTALPGDYAISVTLQDLNDVTSNDATATLRVLPPIVSTAPEPSTLMLMATGLLLLPWVVRRRSGSVRH